MSTMNAMIVGAVRGPQERESDFARRYAELSERYGDAADRGDEVGMAVAEHNLDKLVSEAREARGSE